jgi:hypothetical protein
MFKTIPFKVKKGLKIIALKVNPRAFVLVIYILVICICFGFRASDFFCSGLSGLGTPFIFLHYLTICTHEVTSK